MSALAEYWLRAAARFKGFTARRWQQLLAWRGRWRSREDTVNLILAGLVGVLGGLANWVFLFLTDWIKLLMLNHSGDPALIAELLPPWLRFAVPALGALLAGLTLHWGLRWVQSRGSTNLLEVVVAGDGRLPFRPNIVKTASSLLSVASGASIGREGAIVQLSATLASKAGQIVESPPYRLRLLVACGAAAGMAAAYHAPISGAVFAAQIVLGNFSMNLFAPLICSAVVAAVLTRSFFGVEPLYQVPGLEITGRLELPWFVVLGAFSGFFGAVLLKLLQRSEAFFDSLRQPIYVRLLIAGLITGVLAMEVPGVWGNGYAVTSRLLAEHPYFYSVGMVAILLLAKLASTLAAVGSGTVGGVFTPTLFVGAALGCLFGHGLHEANLTHVPVGAFALAGMGALLAATTHSPLLAMIMLFEISLNYSLMPALMLACAVGTLVSRRLHANSVYTEPLRQKGLLGETETDQLGTASQQTVGDLMREPVPPVTETATFQELGQRFLSSPYNFLPVVDANRRLTGVIALQDLKAYLNAGEELQAVIAFDVMRPPPACLVPNQRLHEALPVLLTSELRNIPVVRSLGDRRLVGSLSRAEALSVLSEAIASKSAAKG